MPTFEQISELLRVAVVTDDSGAAHRLTGALRESGCAVRAFSLTGPSACARVRELNPAVVVLRVGGPEASSASSYQDIAGNHGPALVLVTPAASGESLGLARESGAFMHLVEPVIPQALVAAVWLACARGEELWQLSRRVIGLRESFVSLRVVERAKAILMRRLQLTEQEAHRRLQVESRNRNRKLVETAWHVIQADARLSRGGTPRSRAARFTPR